MALIWKEITDPGMQWDLIQAGLAYQYPDLGAARYNTCQQGFAWSRKEWLRLCGRGHVWFVYILLEE